MVKKAFEGAESVFWVVPPLFGAPDVKAYYLDFSRPAVEAAKAYKVKRVVSVSSLGRHLERQAGVASASYAKDALFEKSGFIPGACGLPDLWKIC